MTAMQERRIFATADDESTGATTIFGFVTTTSRRAAVVEEKGTPSESFCETSAKHWIAHDESDN